MDHSHQSRNLTEAVNYNLQFLILSKWTTRGVSMHVKPKTHTTTTTTTTTEQTKKKTWNIAPGVTYWIPRRSSAGLPTTVRQPIVAPCFPEWNGTEWTGWRITQLASFLRHASALTCHRETRANNQPSHTITDRSSSYTHDGLFAAAVVGLARWFVEEWFHTLFYSV